MSTLTLALKVVNKYTPSFSLMRKVLDSCTCCETTLLTSVVVKHPAGILQDVQSTTGHRQPSLDLLLVHWRRCTGAWRERTWTCVCVSEPHLKTGNSEAPGIVWRRGHRDDERAVGDVFVVETDGNLIVSWWRKESEWEGHPNTATHTHKKTLQQEAEKTREWLGETKSQLLPHASIHCHLSSHQAPAQCKTLRWSRPCGPQRQFQPYWAPPQQCWGLLPRPLSSRYWTPLQGERTTKKRKKKEQIHAQAKTAKIFFFFGHISHYMAVKCWCGRSPTWLCITRERESVKKCKKWQVKYKWTKILS